MIAIYLILSILLIIMLVFIFDILRLIRIKSAKELPDEKDAAYYSADEYGRKFENLYEFLANEGACEKFSDDEMFNMLLRQSEYMNNRFDCSDFRAQLMIKIYYDFEDSLSERNKFLIKKTFLNFKYFMDEPGNDSMCYWSENHQILFAVVEYLAGQKWHNEIFFNSGMTGKEHMLKAKQRIDIWMNQRFLYGFSEYLSNNYLAEDIAPMANFIAYAKDKESVQRMKIIMDLLWLDVALNSVNNRFVAVSSRMYGNNKAGNYFGNSLISAMNILWGQDCVAKILSSCHYSENEIQLLKENLAKKPNYIVLCFTDVVKKKLYVLPEIIKNIALSNESFAVKMGCGLSVEDLREEKLIGQETDQIMAQLGAEAFTNSDVIENTLLYIENNKMFSNSFLSYFKYLKLLILKPVNLRRFAEKYNMMTHGIATGRGNVYTYRTAHFSMSTVIAGDSDMCGAQDHEFSCNIGEGLSFFLTHPAGNGNSRFTSSPGYWIGNGRRPMSLQYEKVNITIYKMPKKRRFGELDISDISHAYMPLDYYDETEQKGNIVFARKNGVFLALIANGNLCYKPFSDASLRGIYKHVQVKDKYRIKNEFDLVRKGGDYHCYITEISDIDTESYEEFKNRILKNSVSFEKNGKVVYDTYFGNFCASFDGEFSINGIEQEKKYLRYDCKFCRMPRKASSVFISDNKNSLRLDFDNCIREIL